MDFVQLLKRFDVYFPVGCDNSLIMEAHHFRVLGDDQVSVIGAHTHTHTHTHTFLIYQNIFNLFLSKNLIDVRRHQD